MFIIFQNCVSIESSSYDMRQIKCKKEIPEAYILRENNEFQKNVRDSLEESDSNEFRIYSSCMQNRNVFNYVLCFFWRFICELPARFRERLKGLSFIQIGHL